MNDQKQLIKAINDLTKAVIKNTEAIKENTKFNCVESGTPDDLKKWYTWNENNDADIEVDEEERQRNYATLMEGSWMHDADDPIDKSYKEVVKAHNEYVKSKNIK